MMRAAALDATFEVVSRQRPLALVAPATARGLDPAAVTPLPRPAPYAALVGELARSGPASLTLASGPVRLTGWWADGRIGLTTRTSAGDTDRRSRRFGRLPAAPRRLALTLTGTQLCVWALLAEGWEVRGRADLHELADMRDPGLCGALTAAGSGMSALTAGGFGHLGLRDLRFATDPTGETLRHPDGLLLTATHAGPGFFDTAHTGVWALDPETHRLTPLAELFFSRHDRPGAYGDHSTHLVRDGDRWLVATSTWGDFDPGARSAAERARTGKRAVVEVTLATTDADLTAGSHLLATGPLRLPGDGMRSVAVWDPHLVRTDEGWLVGYVSATKFFAFHPVVASGPTLDRLRLHASATERIATEGATLLRTEAGWQLLASDGRDGRRTERGRFPVWTLPEAPGGPLVEGEPLDAPYPTNLPWPNLARLDDGSWLLATFNGAAVGGRLVGYGSHGDVVVMRGL